MTHSDSRKQSERRIFVQKAICAGVAMLVAGTTAAAPSALNLAQTPLFLGGTDPNIMFVLDASGSMAWSFLPENNGAAILTGGKCYTANFPKALTSSAFNKLYYDPTATYLPPMNADGTTKAAASFTAASKNGYTTGAATVNLSTSFVESWGDTSIGSTSTAGSGCYVANTAAAAFYNTMASTCSISGSTAPADSCFTTTTVSATSGPSRVRPELGNITSTDERTNFANWYTYYRTRINTAKAGISRAFGLAGTGMYLGYGALNSGSSTIDGVTTNTLVRGVRPFKDDSTQTTTANQTWRTAFYNWLFAKTALNGTPLRSALDDAGKYYETSTAAYNSKPWDPTNGNAIACRQSYTILTTDGYWNDSDINGRSLGNVDNTTGSTIKSADGTTSYTYSPVGPFSDSNSNTLADVAMYYWYRDLRTTLDNNVPTSTSDPAFWQHMSTFTIGLGVTGTVDPTTAFADITSKTTVTWPAPSTTGTTQNVDDLLHAAVNGRGGFFSAQNPQQFANSLSSTLAAIAARKSSATSVSTNSATLTTNSVVYEAIFDSGKWTGDVVAYKIDPTTQALTSLATAASKIPAASGRNILTWRPSYTSGSTTVPAAGVAFTTSNLSTAQQSAITTGISNANLDSSVTWSDIVSYIRGDQTKEMQNGGLLRTRTSLLGDIVNSSPVYAGKDDYGYGSAPSIAAAARTAYASFVSSQVPTVYTGANDGMLHAFNGSSTASTALNEVFAYVPNTILGNLPYLAQATDFSHKYFVDGQITIGHAYLSGAWKTVLVGSTGAGGKTYFAIDVTTPSSPTVMWEYTDTELGYTLGKATVTRLPTGDWAAIFGNGYNSTSENASLYIVNLATGVLIKKLDVTSRDTTLANGLATPLAADADADGTTDVIYAGDLQGQLWKFNISSTSATDWAVSFGGKPLFQTPITTSGTSTYHQPITSQPKVAHYPTGGAMVFFGTGKFFETGDQADLDPQAFYGVRDVCLLTTGSGCTTGVSTAKVALTDLVKQTFTESTNTYTNPSTGTTSTSTVRTLSSNKDTTKLGYYIPLLVSGSTANTGERVVAAPTLLDDRVIFTSIVPNEDVCGFGGNSWLFEVDLYTGGATTYSVFDFNKDGSFTSVDAGNATKISGLVGGTPAIVAADASNGFTLSGTSDPAVAVNRTNLNRTLGRQTWRQIE